MLAHVPHMAWHLPKRCPRDLATSLSASSVLLPPDARQRFDADCIQDLIAAINTYAQPRWMAFDRAEGGLRRGASAEQISNTSCMWRLARLGSMLGHRPSSKRCMSQSESHGH